MAGRIGSVTDQVQAGTGAVPVVHVDVTGAGSGCGGRNHDSRGLGARRAAEQLPQCNEHAYDVEHPESDDGPK